MTINELLVIFIGCAISTIIGQGIGESFKNSKKSNITDYGCREDFSSRGKEDEY